MKGEAKSSEGDAEQVDGANGIAMAAGSLGVIVAAMVGVGAMSTGTTRATSNAISAISNNESPT